MADNEHALTDDDLYWSDGGGDNLVQRRNSSHAVALAALLGAIVVVAVFAISELANTQARVLRVTSGSMQPTLAIGQQVHLDTSAYAAAPPRIGDIIAFHPPAGATATEPVCGTAQAPGAVCPQATSSYSDQIFVKRVVAGPGDTIAIVDGSAIRNGALEREPPQAACDDNAGCNYPVAVHLPAEAWFVMGDNRGASDDSRYWGPVPRAWIIGKVLAR